MSENNTGLLINNVSYRIADTILIDKLSLYSPMDNCTGVIGHNGAGKTTLLRLCHGLQIPDTGEIYWNGKNPVNMGKRITMIFQKPCLLRRSTYANLDYVLRLHRIPPKLRKQRITEAFQLIGLTHRIDHPAHSLSGGEQQRLAIARAYVLRPEIVLMDEPTAGLDMASIQIVEKMISDLSQQGIKIIIASHNVALIRRLCNEVIFLHQGKLLTQSNTDDFFHNPKEEIVCNFIRLQDFA